MKSLFQRIRASTSSINKIILRAALAYWSLMMISAIIGRPSPRNTAVGITCPDGYAIKIPADEPNAGKYITCEDFDHYYTLLEAKRIPEARELTFSAPTKDLRKIASVLNENLRFLIVSPDETKPVLTSKRN